MSIINSNFRSGSIKKPQASYSQVGQEVAAAACDAYDHSKGSSAYKDRQLMTALRKIAQDTKSTPTEKSLASVGLNVRPEDGLGRAYMHHARRQIAQSIAAAVPGTMGSVIAQATLQAANKLVEWTPSHDNLLQAGLEEIKGARGVADQTKNMANFALNLGQVTGPGHEKDFIFRKSVIEGISKGSY
jgi:hypothetical protein